MVANPFKPTAGKMPPILIGRQAVIDDFAEGIDNGAGAPGRLMLITGQRGYGKTVLLTELRRVAQARGWATLAETASPGLIERLVEALAPQGASVTGASLAPSVSIPGLASLSLGRVDLSPHAAPLTLRNAIEQRLDDRRLAKGKGVLITVDETQAASRDDLVAIATAVQHVIASQDQLDLPDDEKKGVALVFAGLPSAANDLLNDEVTTFLRRALHRSLGAVPAPDVRNAYVEAFAGTGKSIPDDLAQRAADLTDGYPYMIQLVGYYMWQSAKRDGRDAVSAADVERSKSDALAAFNNAVCAPALSGLPPAAQEMASLVAQAGPGPVRIADLEQSSGKSRSWLNKYRAILCANEMATAPQRGYVELSIPHLAEYLRGQ